MRVAVAVAAPTEPVTTVDRGSNRSRTNRPGSSINKEPIRAAATVKEQQKKKNSINSRDCLARITVTGAEAGEEFQRANGAKTKKDSQRKQQ